MSLCNIDDQHLNMDTLSKTNIYNNLINVRSHLIVRVYSMTSKELTAAVFAQPQMAWHYSLQDHLGRQYKRDFEAISILISTNSSKFNVKTAYWVDYKTPTKGVLVYVTHNSSITLYCRANFTWFDDGFRTLAIQHNAYSYGMGTIFSRVFRDTGLVYLTSI